MAKKRSNDVDVLIKTHRDKMGGHPHVIIETIENKHVSVGLSTHKKPGCSSTSTNYFLEKNPLQDGKTSYMRRQGTVDYKRNYENPRRGIMTPNDYERAKTYGERVKLKHFNKQKK